MFGLLLFTAVFAIIYFTIFKLSSNTKQYFEQCNLKYKGIGFVLHNFFRLALGKIDIFDNVKMWYDVFPNDS